MAEADPPNPVPDSQPPAPPAGDTAAPVTITAAAAAHLFAVGRAQRHSASSAWEPPSVADLQRMLPQHEIHALLGRGGMGAVYRGTQLSLEREVAIKILPPEMAADDPQFPERFKLEAKAMARLNHPGIVAVFDAGETAEGLLYFVMEYVEGTDVQAMLAARGLLPAAEALPIVAQVCEALEFAHESGIVHRDIKPSNIMLDAHGRVKVADFGLARATTGEGDGLTGASLAIGTAEFSAPETFLPDVKLDGRADLYAVGVMLYQMLTGKIPRGRFALPSHCVAGLDPRIDAVVDKAMQADRERRYATALELRDDVNRILAAAPERSLPALAAPVVRGKAPRWIMVAAIVALAAGGALWWSRSGGAWGAGNPAVIPGAAVEKAAAEEIRHRWRPVPSKQDAPINRGAVHLMHFDTWGAPGYRLTNAAVRATIAWQESPPGHNELIKVKARWTTTEHYYACLYGSIVELGFYRAPNSTALQRWSVDPPPAPGETLSLQLACVGHRLAVWVRDRLVGELDDGTLSGPANVGVQAVDGHIESLEYLDLDGLAEAAAFQRLGLDVRGSTATARVGATPARGIASWRDALAESPLKEVIAKTERTPQGYRLPEGNHWRISPQSVGAGALRVRATSSGAHFVSLCLFLDDGGVRRVRFREQTQELVLSRGEPGAAEIDVAAWSGISCTDAQPHEILFARLGDRLKVMLDGRWIHEVPDPGAVPGKFGLTLFGEARIDVDKVEYLDLDGVPAAAAQELLTIGKR